MQESWVTLYCTECGDDWEERVGELPHQNGEFACSGCGNEARVKEFLHSDRDLEVYESLD